MALSSDQLAAVLRSAAVQHVSGSTVVRIAIKPDQAADLDRVLASGGFGKRSSERYVLNRAKGNERDVGDGQVHLDLHDRDRLITALTGIKRTTAAELD